jgi:hypothetical protein
VRCRGECRLSALDPFRLCVTAAPQHLMLALLCALRAKPLFAFVAAALLCCAHTLTHHGSAHVDVSAGHRGGAWLVSLLSARAHRTCVSDRRFPSGPWLAVGERVCVPVPVLNKVKALALAWVTVGRHGQGRAGLAMGWHRCFLSPTAKNSFF